MTRPPGYHHRGPDGREDDVRPLRGGISKVAPTPPPEPEPEGPSVDEVTQPLDLDDGAAEVEGELIPRECMDAKRVATEAKDWEHAAAMIRKAHKATGKAEPADTALQALRVDLLREHLLALGIPPGMFDPAASAASQR